MEKIKQVSLWFFTPFSCWFLFVILVLTSVFFVDVSEMDVRISGFVFQIIGIVATLLVLNSTKGFFKYHGIKRRFVDWVVMCPIWYKKVASGSAKIECVMHARAEGYRVISGDGKQINERISQLEDYVKYIMERVVKTKEEIYKDIHKIEALYADERKLRSDGLAAVEKIVRDNTINGIALAEVGLATVTVGALLSSFPMEIVNFINYIK